MKLSKFINKQISKKRILKYFIYAIGEFILIVVGILFALQINKWNENKKRDIIESQILTNIQANLLVAKEEIIEDIQFNNWTIKQLKLIQNYMWNDLNYDSKLDNSFLAITSWESPFLTTSAYQSLKNQGINIIKNNDLREKIIYLYEINYNFLVNDYDKTEWNFSQSIVWPFLIKNMKLNDYKSNMLRPKDFNLLKSNSEFETILSQLIDLREKGIINLEKTKHKINTLIKDIEEEGI